MNAPLPLPALPCPHCNAAPELFQLANDAYAVTCELHGSPTDDESEHATEADAVQAWNEACEAYAEWVAQGGLLQHGDGFEVPL
jgi:hypothetical protein